MIALWQKELELKREKKRAIHREYMRNYRKENPITLLKDEEARRRRLGRVKRIKTRAWWRKLV